MEIKCLILCCFDELGLLRMIRTLQHHTGATTKRSMVYNDSQTVAIVT